MDDNAVFSRASLGIYSYTHRASDVTTVLGLAPSTVHELGDARVDRSGRQYSAYSTSVWTYDPDDSLIVPDDTGFAALRALVTDILPFAAKLATLRPHYETIIRWTGEVSSQGNFVIESELILDLGALGCTFFGTANALEGDPDQF